jgi:hypothetical protein
MFPAHLISSHRARARTRTLRFALRRTGALRTPGLFSHQQTERPMRSQPVTPLSPTSIANRLRRVFDEEAVDAAARTLVDVDLDPVCSLTATATWTVPYPRDMPNDETSSSEPRKPSLGCRSITPSSPCSSQLGYELPWGTAPRGSQPDDLDGNRCDQDAMKRAHPSTSTSTTTSRMARRDLHPRH